MSRIAVVLAFLAVSAYAATLPFNYLELSQQLKDVVPESVRNFYTELTDEDKVILKEVAANHADYADEDQALEALKGKSEKLYNKAVELRNLLKSKIEALKPGAKTFVENIIATLRTLKPKAGEKPDINKLKAEATKVIESYKALSEEDQTSLKETFPNTVKIIQNEKVQSIANTLLKAEN